MINNWTSAAGASNMISLGWLTIIFVPSTRRVIAVLMPDRIIEVEGNKCL